MSEQGQRPIRIGNCSGATSDPGYQMFRQATLGPIDVITGDYLAELNLALNARSYAAGTHPGYEPTARDGLLETLPILNEKGIKVILNGGALNPRGLAEEIHQAIQSGGYNLTVAWVDGDNVLALLPELIKTGLQHLDPFSVPENAKTFLADPEQKPVVTAHAYLGARGIRKALDAGADIVVCGRVADASPVIAAAGWWFSWLDTEFEKLAHALVAGHLIECSAYATGANFSGFEAYPLETFVDVGFPIVEIEENGVHTVTKHEGTNGLVNRDIIRCQLLYELQGNIYLNSDVKADLSTIEVEDVGKDRVRVSGIRGFPPPPTTKLAIFFADGYQCEFLLNATGTNAATNHKFTLFETQLKSQLSFQQALNDFDVLEFQRIGLPELNPTSQLRNTTYLRCFAQASTAQKAAQLAKAFTAIFMQHFSGLHCSMDLRTIAPKPFLTYFPAVMEQSLLREQAHILGELGASIDAGHPPVTEALLPRENYDPPIEQQDLEVFGPTELRPLGDIALARSGDKGANVNIGLFIPSTANNKKRAWEWLRRFLTRGRIQQLMGTDWKEGYVIERVEFPKIQAVHFVIYGALGRGVSSSSSVDGLGKGFADFIRARWISVPMQFLEKARL
ncbi:hypothetical protein FN846DRAFT_937536 [Sphaerosporella brunnea]|uniref:DUF1446-domain-containing protein n=1 Tax=Sphaerosporella brunnea TaxID=1250544 RepID=A0A5J5F3K1_9PEZI|nr:hypothetical protein FN846DRAFT_937536 [Sphaerosporella brunnea]